MTEIEFDGNGHTIAYRVGRLEAEVERKAEVSTVERLEDGQAKVEATLNKLVTLAFAATLSGATAAVLLIVQIYNT